MPKPAKDQLQLSSKSPKISALERRNGIQMIALENIFQTVPNFFIFEQLLTELYKKKELHADSPDMAQQP